MTFEEFEKAEYELIKLECRANKSGNIEEVIYIREKVSNLREEYNAMHPMPDCEVCGQKRDADIIHYLNRWCNKYTCANITYCKNAPKVI